VTSGVIQSLATLREAGITLILQGQDGMGYGYMHLQGYAPGIVEGKPVRTGELLGYVGRTGIRESAAHLHFQVYADHRLSRDDLLNPYNFLVQLCRGVGVSDLYPQRIARLEEPQPQANRIQVYRRPGVPAQRAPGSQRLVKDSPVLVIRNY
jgi:murein DD-endopeptidase MepM/ murein hydrolase activator NlpD